MEKFNFIEKKSIKKILEKTGIYCFQDKNGNILYIGKAANLKERVKNHFQQPSFQDNLFIEKIAKIGYIQTNSEIEALILEANLIKKYQPKFNVMWRDDKNYFFVGITKESFPCIFVTHQPVQQAQGKLKQKTDFVGPFVDGRALKETLKFLRKIFPYRTCKNIPKRPCLWYQLSRCPAPCALISSQLKNAERKLKEKCQQNAKNIFKILEGKRGLVLNNLRVEMTEDARLQNFEEAAKIRDKIYALQKTLSHSKIFDFREITEPKENWLPIQKNLKKILNVKKEIARIEAYDISNIQGENATGSMVVFTNGKPDKNQYRKFKIKIGEKPNDTAMIKEILIRRFNHREWPNPDLILIDGGKPQLNIAVKAKFQNPNSKNIKVVALAKKDNKLFIENRKQPILLKILPREIFNLILQLRDEAHRFAITYHRKLRKKFLIR